MKAAAIINTTIALTLPLLKSIFILCLGSPWRYSNLFSGVTLAGKVVDM